MKFLILLLSFNAFSFAVKTNNLSIFTSNLIHELATLEQISNDDINTFNIAFSQNPDFSESTDQFLLKQLLNKGSGLSPKEVFLDQKLFDLLKSKVVDIPDRRKFTKSIYNSFLQDVGELLTDPLYTEYIKMKRFNKLSSSSEFRIYTNKIKLIAPWISLLIGNEIEEVNLRLDEIQRSLFSTLINLVKISARTNSQSTFLKTEYITKIDIDLENARNEIDNLDFIVSPAPDPNYITPTQLPIGVDDWVPVDESIIENGLPLTRDRLFPEPDPDYVVPEVLPTPVDKWQ